MKETDRRRAAVCPLCRKAYTGHSAISRTDNETRICPDCGTRQALSALGVGADEQSRILATIHAYTRGVRA
ncbi:MAG: hypothetical protein IJQ25_03685 [Oscillibacter sp.]|nr:hypothetical protein [Oscillibacter sp.]